MSPTSNLAKPKLACEIAADRVLAGRLTEKGDGLEASAARELAPGSVIPDLVENNLRQREAVRSGIEGALGAVSGRSKDVIAIVPDAAVRVMLVEFDTLPSDEEEALGVVRLTKRSILRPRFRMADQPVWQSVSAMRTASCPELHEEAPLIDETWEY